MPGQIKKKTTKVITSLNVKNSLIQIPYLQPPGLLEFDDQGDNIEQMNSLMSMP